MPPGLQSDAESCSWIWGTYVSAGGAQPIPTCAADAAGGSAFGSGFGSGAARAWMFDWVGPTGPEGFHWSVPMTVPAAPPAAAGISDTEARCHRRCTVNPDVWSMTVPELVTISIDVFCQEALSIAPVIPLMVACAPEKFAVPKLASGKTPDDGRRRFHDPFRRGSLCRRCLGCRKRLGRRVVRDLQGKRAGAVGDAGGNRIAGGNLHTGDLHRRIRIHFPPSVIGGRARPGSILLRAELFDRGSCSRRCPPRPTSTRSTCR